MSPRTWLGAGNWFIAESRAFFGPRAATWDAGFGDDMPAYAAAVDEAAIPALKRSLADLAKHRDQLTRLIKTRLKRMQHRPALLNGLPAHTHLPLW